MVGILESCLEIDFGERTFSAFNNFLRIFKTFFNNPLMRCLIENFKKLSFESSKASPSKVRELFHVHIAKEVLFHKGA